MGTKARVGFDELHFAPMTEGTDGTVSYEAPTKISGAMTGTVTPGINWANLSADDQIVETAQSMGPVEVSFGVAELDPKSRALILGKTINADGAIIDDATDEPPYGALGWRAKRSDGSYEYTWLLKGKFGEPEESYNTQAESIEFQNQTVNGRFLPRQDKKWRSRIIEGTEAATQAVIDSWFDEVYDTETEQA